jgi:hypothetical protein
MKHQPFSRLGRIAAVLAFAAAAAFPLQSGELPLVKNVELQPLAAQVRRLVEAGELLGSPFSPEDRRALAAAMDQTDEPAGLEALQRVLDRYCLAGVEINPESRVKVVQGPAKPELAESGWRQFLVKVQNSAGVTAELRVVSPNAQSLFEGGATRTASDQFYRRRGASNPLTNPSDLWLDLMMFNQQPLQQQLSGLGLEYRVIELYSRDAGSREARLSFNVGQGTQDLGYRSEADILFQCAPAAALKLKVLDENDAPVMAMFLIRDQLGRVFPSQAKRLAPDFAFHPQIYRGDGETIKLPPGAYTVEYGRGPEYLSKTEKVVITGRPQTLACKLERWIDPSKSGWWSGDHHIHAAGCAHYTKPSEGVLAADMMRQCLGEDVKIGCNLTWGPCFDFQKQFFTGQDDKVSKFPYLLHYDIEVSGFGSHQSGHLCLLDLKEEIYPGGDSDKHWPTLCLNILRWAKRQGAVSGPAHSGWGLEVKTSELPNYEVPPFDGIGADEYIVDVTHELPGPDGKLGPAVDFMSMVDTPSVWELNMWYHTLNVGYRTRISGETDFPCIYGERVGLGRSYVKLGGKLTYQDWCEGIRAGRNYVGDGRSHLMDFKINDIAMGENGSELRLAAPGLVHATLRAAARLNAKPDPSMRQRPYEQKPYWDIERARIGESGEVPVEVLVNGSPVARRTLVADGRPQDMAFDLKIERSSWVAVRILPSSHTNPIFVLVGDKPVRASRRSAEWCLKGVDRCWSQKQKFIKADELTEAKTAYAHAREAYQKLLDECEVE